MAKLRAYYPAATLPPETVAAYATVLIELDLRDCANACGLLVRERESAFYPSIGEIVQRTKRVAAERRRREAEAERERERQLEEQRWTPEQLADNRARLAELVSSLGAHRQIDPPKEGQHEAAA